MTRTIEINDHGHIVMDDISASEKAKIKTRLVEVEDELPPKLLPRPSKCPKYLLK